MSYRPSREAWQSNPPIGTGIDWSHPLSQGLVGCWLFNEGGGSKAINLATAELSTLVSTGTGKLTTYGYNNNGTNNNYIEATTTTGVIVSGITIFIDVTLSTVNTEKMFVSKGYYSANKGYFFDHASNASLQFVCGSTYVSSLTGVAAIGRNSYVASKKGTVGNLYKNGNLLTKAENIALSTADLTTQTFRIGGHYDGAYGSNGTIHTVLVYNRALSANEIKALHENPYQICQSNPSSVYLPRSLDPTKNAFRWY